MNWHDYFTYDPVAGDLIWKERPESFFANPNKKGCFITWNKTYPGKRTGSPNARGYLMVSLFGKQYYCHRIIWEMHNGPIPKGYVIDHSDRNMVNNRIENLDCCLQRQNLGNSSIRSNNRSGVRGVYYNDETGKWVARIHVSKKCIRLGSFITKGEAAVAYAKASLMHYVKHSCFYDKKTAAQCQA